MRARSLLALLPLAMALVPSAAGQSPPQLTEFLARNNTGITDIDGDLSDWIEIYNPSLAPVDLGTWRLTDDATDLSKWVFPPTVIPAGGFVVVFASDKDRAVSGQELHTNFKLSTAGEYLALVQPNGIPATQYAPSYPAQVGDVSYGLEADLITRSFFDPPTPGAPNQPGGQLLEPIAFSHAHGVVDAAFSLTLSHPNPLAVIRYTIDGSEPTASQGLVYTSPLPVAQITTVRARAFAPSFLPSELASATWIFPGDVLGQDLSRALALGMPATWIDVSGANWTLGGVRPGASYGFDTLVTSPFTPAQIRDSLRSLPTVSLLIHPDDLFGYMAATGRDGIYANSVEEGPLWERACSVEWIDPLGGPEFTIQCGTSIQGGSVTGPILRGQLSFALKFKSVYGPSKLDFPVFPGSPVESFDYLVLDGGNQISISGSAGTSTKIHAQETRDEFASDVHEHMGHLAPKGRWVHLYLNGMYWGAYHLHDRPDERFAAAHGSGAVPEYDWVKRGVVLAGNDSAVNSLTPGLWNEVRDIVSNGVAPGSTWHGGDAYTALAQRVDMTSYVDYLLMNWYCGNTDWPQNNWMATARARLSASFGHVNPDGRFVFHNWDAEATLYWGGAVTAVNDGFWDRTGIQSASQANAVFIHTAALQHPDYLSLLADRAQRHLLTPGGTLWVEPGFDQLGTPFDPAHAERNVPASLYFPLVSELGAATVMEYGRWGNYFGFPGLYSPADWLTERDRLLTDYFPIRSGVIVQQLRAATPQLLPDLEAPTVSLAPGRYPVGTPVTLGHNQGATLYYTVDGSDPRLPLGAIDPTAFVGAGPGALPRGVTQLRARAHNGTEWSPLIERTYVIGFRVRINEIQADNVSTVRDNFGEFEDWIELRNLTNDTLDLGGFFLTDDPARPTRYEIPVGVTIAPKGRLVLWADEDTTQGPEHLNFKLSERGEFVGLYAPQGLVGLAIDSTNFPAQRSNHSYARLPDGRGPFARTPRATPNAPNGLGQQQPQ